MSFMPPAGNALPDFYNENELVCCGHIIYEIQPLFKSKKNVPQLNLVP